MSLKSEYMAGVRQLESAGVPEPGLDAWYLLEHVTGISRAAYYACPDRELTEEQRDEYARCIERRKKRIPLQHITGVQEFMGLAFDVNKDVLIPRQDTEILVEEALDILRKRGRSVCRDSQEETKILDLCTGSGCILLSVLYYAGDNISGTGSDLSEKALMTARKNAEKLSISAEFIQGDLFENISGSYSMILSNPPYIKSGDIDALQDEVRFYDPRMALDGKEDGLYFYRRITEESTAYLKRGGCLMFEIGCDQAADVSDMMRARGFSQVTVKKDLAGLDRIVYGRYS